MIEVRTFVNDERQYAEMVKSFEQAGFGPFIRLSDREDDPYRAIDRIGTEGPVVLCHQDVRADQGHEAQHLLRCLEELDRLDPLWVVAGNAGVPRNMRIVRRLQDPYGGSTGEPLPIKVLTLDENFLVFNPRNPPCCTPGLHGFHLYGTDVCLNGAEQGGSAYVIDFPITHLGEGEITDAYLQAEQRLVDAWNGRCTFRYLRTPVGGMLFLSRFGAFRRLFGAERARASVKQYWRARNKARHLLLLDH